MPRVVASLRRGWAPKGRLARTPRLSSARADAVTEWTELAESAVPGRMERYIDVGLGHLRRGDVEIRIRVEREDGTGASAAQRVAIEG